jgi:hypothetical protein
MLRLIGAILVVLILSACGSERSTQSPTPDPSPTRFDGLRGWLTPERQERLADQVTTVAKDHGWAAGCVFRYHVDESVLHAFPWPAGTAAYSVVNDSELYPAIVMYVEGTTKASGNFKEVLPDAAFCYVPE